MPAMTLSSFGPQALKVLHVIPSISPRRGGPSQAAIEMVNALRLRQVDASILTTNDDCESLLTDLPIGAWTTYAGVPVLAFPRWNPPIGVLKEYIFSSRLNRWLPSNIRNFDLIHVHALFSYPSTVAMMHARRARIPYLLRTIGQLSPWSLAQSKLRKQFMLKLVERRNLDAASLLHFTTTRERDECFTAFGQSFPSLVLPLGVRLPPLLPETKPKREGLRLLFLSRLHPKKQLEVLLKALALFQSDYPQGIWQLDIAGSGEPAYLASLQKLAGQLNVSHRCRWLGHVQGDAKTSLLQQADWFLLPSAAENFGIAVVEAMAAGTPVIVSPQVAVADLIVGAGAGLVCPSDPASLCKVLLKHYQGPSSAMRMAARSLAETTFSWSSVADQLESRYRQILHPLAIQ
jgi:glycosyltransferase involved in cell wall biosynthesis